MVEGTGEELILYLKSSREVYVVPFVTLIFCFESNCGRSTSY